MYNKRRHSSHVIIGIIVSMLICCVMAHSFIPHHHHNSTVCVTACSHHQASDCTDGEHDSHAHGDMECMMDNVVVRDSGSQKVIQPAISDILFSLHLYHICYCSCMQEKTGIVSYLNYKPYLESYYTSYVAPTLGLRAPPRI